MTDIVHGAHSDNVNQVFSMLGVIGTLGTADTKATAQTLPIGVNPDNGAMYVDVLDTTFNVGTLSVGTINQVGTISSGTIKTIDSLAPYVFDTINVTYPSGTTESYQYKLGTTVLGTITVTFSDSTKGSITSVVKTP